MVQNNVEVAVLPEKVLEDLGERLGDRAKVDAFGWFDHSDRALVVPKCQRWGHVRRRGHARRISIVLRGIAVIDGGVVVREERH